MAQSGTGSIINVLHYEFDGYTPGLSELEEATDALVAAYVSNLQTALSTLVAIFGVKWRQVDVPNLPEILIPPSGGQVNGSNANDPLPAQVALLVTARAPTAYPRTARTYLGGFCEDNNANNGRPLAVLRDSAAEWLVDASVLEITGAANAQRVTVEYGGAPRVVVAWNTLLTGNVATVWSTLRSRKPGVGI